MFIRVQDGTLLNLDFVVVVKTRKREDENKTTYTVVAELAHFYPPAPGPFNRTDDSVTIATFDSEDEAEKAVQRITKKAEALDFSEQAEEAKAARRESQKSGSFRPS